jgi:hypothetical protein
VSQPQHVHVTVEKNGGCFSGCGTVLGVLLLIGLAVKYWYVALVILAVVAVAGFAANAQQKAKPAPRRPGRHDPWINEVAVELADLGLLELTRNTGSKLGGMPLMADVGLRANRFLVYVNLFAADELARRAEIGLRASDGFRTELTHGRTALRTSGRVLHVATGRGGAVDELLLDDVVRTVDKVGLPPSGNSPVPSPDVLGQLRELGDLNRKGILSDGEFEAKKAELLRRL